MSKQLKVNVTYTGKSDPVVASEAVAAVDGLTGNSNFPNPPFDLAAFKAEVETFASTIAATIDGGPRATVAKNKQRIIVIKMMRQLGHWVEANCKDDLSILKSSGFQPHSMTRTPVAPLQGPPSIDKVVNGPNSGQVLIRVKPRPNALSYILRYAPVAGADGKPAWGELTPFTNTRSVTVNGLTPGTTYLFQVRALGRTGYTDWSDSVTRMSM